MKEKKPRLHQVENYTFSRCDECIGLTPHSLSHNGEWKCEYCRNNLRDSEKTKVDDLLIQAYFGLT